MPALNDSPHVTLRHAAAHLELRSSPVGRHLLVAGLLLAVAFAGCGRLGRESIDPPEAPVLVVGLDGFEWNVLLPLVREGLVPTIERLMKSGSYGLLETTRPTFSPIIWTSIATGKSQAEHGIHGFVRNNPEGEGKRLFNSYDRRTKAFWNILSDYGRSVAVVGWWMTFPAEPVNGVMVAQVNTLDQADRKHGNNILKGGLLEGVRGQVYPADRLEDCLEINRRVSEQLPELNRENFGEFELPMSPLVERFWQNTQWAFRADATYAEVTRKLASKGHDVVAFYLGGPDVVGHRFWRYMEPEPYRTPPTDEEIAEYGHVIPDYYRYVDRVIARILEEMPDSTRVLIVSDHGMHSVSHGKAFNSQVIPKDLSSGHHRDAPPGVFIAAGPGIVQSELKSDLKALVREDLPLIGSVIDVTPTLLALVGVPAGLDMAGQVLSRILEPSLAQPARIETHDSSEWLELRAKLDPGKQGHDSERMDQLRALGYIN